MIFVDTGGLVALYVKADPWHDRIEPVFKRLDQERTRYLTTSLILSEVVTMLGARIGAQSAVAVARLILDSGVWTVVRPDLADDVKALSNFMRYAHLERLSFCDAMSFTIMRKHKIASAVTVDVEHFGSEGFGFEVLTD